MDRKFTKGVRLIPRDEEFFKKIIMSRGAIPKHVLELFNLTEAEQKEYENAKTEQELAEICIKDCKKQGAILQKREDL